MRTIGLLGGMSVESSLEYERVIHDEVRRRLGGLHSARTVTVTFDFAEVRDLQEAGDWGGAGELLVDGARRLQAAGADVGVICSNTMHLVFDIVEAGVAMPLLHIADPTADAAVALGLRRVALLGTRFSMERPFLRDRLAARGLDVIVPDQADRTAVDAVIFDELVRGVVEPSSRRRYVEVVDRLIGRGAQGVIAGCTEIELLIGPDDVRVPLLPTARLHAVAAVEAALA